MTTPTDKKCKTLAATLDLLFHIIQSITFPKAEPFKQMTAQVAAERPNQMKSEASAKLFLTTSVSGIAMHGKRCIKFIEIHQNIYL